MKALCAPLFALLALSLAACSSTPATPDDDPITATDWDGPIIQTEISDTPPPEVPEGCAFNTEDPTSYLLLCGPTLAFLNRVALPVFTTPMANAHIAGVQGSLEAAGWTVTLRETYDVTSDQGDIQLTHLLQERGESRGNVFTGFVATGPNQFRAFTCMLTDELMDDWPNECMVRLQLLRGQAEANQVTGVRVRGEQVAIPETCYASDGSVSCGTNTFTWGEYSSDFSESEIKAPERDLAQSIPNVSKLEVACEFAGEPIECSGMRMEPEGYLPQFVVYGYHPVDDGTLRLICEGPIPAEGPHTLPACDLFMAIEMAE